MSFKKNPSSSGDLCPGGNTMRPSCIIKSFPVTISLCFPVTIYGVSTISECELNPNIHSEILQRAVELAKVAYQGDLQTSVELGQRSE